MHAPATAASVTNSGFSQRHACFDVFFTSDSEEGALATILALGNSQMAPMSNSMHRFRKAPREYLSIGVPSRSLSLPGSASMRAFRLGALQQPRRFHCSSHGLSHEVRLSLKMRSKGRAAVISPV